ncbi:MAG TPA: phosphate acetyltransferase [Ardenticatenaceae bacterium]|jgi:phosphate acetyltransferase
MADTNGQNPRRNLLVLSTTATGGKTTVSIGLAKLLSDASRKVAYFKPVAQRVVYEADRPRDRDKIISATVMGEMAAASVPHSLSMDETSRYFAEGHNEYFSERVVEMYQAIEEGVEVVIIEGMQYDDTAAALSVEVNTELAHSLTADVVLIVDAHNRAPEAIVADLESFLGLYRDNGVNVAGVVLNKVPADQDENVLIPPLVTETLAQHNIHLFGAVPFVKKMSAPRLRDLIEPLGARVLRGEEMLSRRVMRPVILAMHAPNAVKHLQSGDLVLVPGDRDDILMMAHLYERALDTPNLAGVVLTVGYEPPESIMNLLDSQGDPAFPILLVESDTYTTSTTIQKKRVYIEDDDWEKIRWTVELIVDHLNREELLSYLNIPTRDIVSPALFRYQIMHNAKALKKRIVLPEGDEPRTLQAAAIILERVVADLVLLGSREAIQREARAVNADISGATVLDPAEEKELFDSFVDEYVELRKHKNMNRTTAADLMADTVYFGTMMLHRGMVDGLVSGAVHTTAHTILPAFQFIKTKPGADLVSSVFFMLLTDRVWVFGDCAVVPNPDAKQLAQIAVQSYHTSKAFGINPKVAMISYSTGSSGEGEDVEKVREATELARQMEPEMLIDGPLQFDAAAIPDVAQKKAPNSPVAGQANVFIFPDLNTGNTTYKAVQRSGNYISVGPVLQGLRRPVNDLSRGALVDDIVYTIAVTSIQAGQIEREPEAEVSAAQ